MFFSFLVFLSPFFRFSSFFAEAHGAAVGTWLSLGSPESKTVKKLPAEDPSLSEEAEKAISSDFSILKKETDLFQTWTRNVFFF